MLIQYNLVGQQLVYLKSTWNSNKGGLKWPTFLDKYGIKYAPRTVNKYINFATLCNNFPLFCFVKETLEELTGPKNRAIELYLNGKTTEAMSLAHIFKCDNVDKAKKDEFFAMYVHVGLEYTPAKSKKSKKQ